MKIYDDIAEEYIESRSSQIGVHDILSFVQQYEKPISILDLGCGSGAPIAQSLIHYTHRYVGVDSSKNLLRYFQQNIPTANTLLTPMQSMDLRGETFDLVFAYGSLFHLTPDQQRRALHLAAASVKNGGILTFTSGIEAGSCLGYVNDTEIPHWSLGESEYVVLLTSEGLTYLGTTIGEGDNCFFTFTRDITNKC